MIFGAGLAPYGRQTARAARGTLQRWRRSRPPLLGSYGRAQQAARGPDAHAAALDQEHMFFVALIARLFGAVVSYTDPQDPRLPVLYVETPEGQMAWRIRERDFWLVAGLPVVAAYPHDGHTVRDRHRRLLRLIARVPNLTEANPVIRPSP